MNVNSPGLETDFRNRLKTETANKIKNEIGIRVIGWGGERGFNL